MKYLERSTQLLECAFYEINSLCREFNILGKDLNYMDVDKVKATINNVIRKCQDSLHYIDGNIDLISIEESTNFNKLVKEKKKDLKCKINKLQKEYDMLKDLNEINR